MERAYALWSSLLSQGYFNEDANTIDWTTATDKVCRGEAAMTLMGTWAIQRLSEGDCRLEPGEGFDFFAFPVLDPDIAKAALGPIDGIVLTRSSANHRFAKRVLAYFAELKPQQEMSKGSGALAPSLQVPRSFYSPFKQRLLAERESARVWMFNYDLATPPAVADRGMDSFNELIAFPNQYRTILHDLQEYLTDLQKSEQSSLSR